MRANSTTGALGSGYGAVLTSERYALRDMGLDQMGGDE